MKVSPQLKLLLRLRPALRFVKLRILHTDDSPERIARGLALGVFVAWLPLMGIQMALAWIAAALFKANKVMALLGAWLSNPATAVVIYYPAYRLGRWLLGFAAHKPEIDPEIMEDLFEETLSLYRLITEFHTPDFWKEVSAAAMNIGLETLLGGVIIGAAAAKLTHWLSFRAVIYYRRRKERKREKKLKKIKTPVTEFSEN